MGFILEAKLAMTNFVQKVNSKSPMKHSLTKNLKCLNPNFIMEEGIKNTRKFKNVLHTLPEANLCKMDIRDAALSEFAEFEDEVPQLDDF